MDLKTKNKQMKNAVRLLCKYGYAVSDVRKIIPTPGMIYNKRDFLHKKINLKAQKSNLLQTSQDLLRLQYEPYSETSLKYLGEVQCSNFVELKARIF